MMAHVKNLSAALEVVNALPRVTRQGFILDNEPREIPF